MALRSGFLAAALAGLLIAAAPAAAATTARVDGNTLFLETAPGEVNELFAIPNSNEGSCGNPFANPCGSIEVRDFNAGVTKGPGCVGSPTTHLCGNASTTMVVATLLDGDDEYSGFRNQQVDAGPGNDRVFTGDGADVIGLGEGNDFARANEGIDTLDGGAGDDELDAQDFRLKHEADRVNCGPGNDRAVVDPLDKVDGCERVLVADTGPAMAVDLPARLKVGRFLGRGLVVEVEVDSDCDVGAVMRLSKATARRFHVVRRIAAAKTKVEDFRGDTVSLRLRASRRIAERLAGARRLKGELEVVCKTGRGRTAITEPLTLRR